MDELMIENLDIPMLAAPISPIHSEPDDSNKSFPFICSECDMKFYSSFAYDSHKSTHMKKINSSCGPLPSFDHIKNPMKIKEEYDSDEQVYMYTYDSHVPYAIKEEIVYETKEANHNQPNIDKRQCINKTNKKTLINNKPNYASDYSAEPLLTDSEVKLELPDVTEVGVYFDHDGRLDFYSLDDNYSALDNEQFCSRKNKFLKEYTDPFMNDQGNPDKRLSHDLKLMPMLEPFDKSDDSFDMDYESSEFPSEWEDDTITETLYQSVNGKSYKNKTNHNDQSNFMKIQCSFKLSKIRKLKHTNAFGCSDCYVAFQSKQAVQEHVMSYKPHTHVLRKNVEIKPLPCSNCDTKGFHLYQILSQRMKHKEDIIYVCLDTNIISVNKKGIWKYFPKRSDNIECNVTCPCVSNTDSL